MAVPNRPAGHGPLHIAMIAPEDRLYVPAQGATRTLLTSSMQMQTVASLRRSHSDAIRPDRHFVTQRGRRWSNLAPGVVPPAEEALVIGSGRATVREPARNVVDWKAGPQEHRRLG